MFKNRLGPGIKALDFGGRPVSTKEVLFGGALAVIVVVALVMAVVHLAHGPIPPARMMHFQCQQPNCHYEFDINDVDLPDEATAHPAEGIAMKCPKCQAERSCVPTQLCPNPSCKKYFVPDPNSPSVVCPYCRTDVAAFAAQEAQRKK